MSNPRDLNIRINGDPANFEAAVVRAQTRLTQMQRTQNSVDREFRAMQSAHGAAIAEETRREQALAEATRRAQEDRAAAWQTAGRAIVMASAAVAAGLAYSAKQAIDWESAWTGVLKTVDGTKSELSTLEAGLRSMTREVSASHTEIAAVAEAAGQLGIATPNILSFTKTMIDLGETTNLSAGEAAMSLARFMGVMGTSQGDASRLGSTVVALGNNFATTEREIVMMAQRLAAAGKVVGLSEADVLALATAMSSVGIEAEAGGTAMSKVMIKISKAIDSGSDDVAEYARVAGMSAADFTTAWANDPVQALVAVVSGLGKMSDAGEGAFQALDDLGLKDVRVTNSMLSLAASSEQVAKAQELANQAWKDNTALVAEAELRYGTTAAKLEMAKNSLNDTAITIGQTFLPMIASAADGLGDFAEWIGNLPAPLLQASAGVGAVVAVAGLLGGSLIMIVPKIRETIIAFQMLSAAHPRAALGFKRVALAAGAAGIAFAAMSVLSAASARDVTKSYEEMFAVLKELPASTDPVKDIFGDLFPDDQLARGEDFAAFLDQMANSNWAERAGNNVGDLGISITRFFGDGSVKWSEQIERMEQYGESLGTLAGDDLPAASAAFNALVSEAGGSEKAARDLLGTMPALRTSLLGIANSAGLATDDASLLKLVMGEIEPPTKDAETGLYGVEAAAAKAATQTKEAAEALQKWRDEIYENSMGFVDPTGAYDAVIAKNQELAEAEAARTKTTKDTWEDYYDGFTVNMADYLADLQAQLDAQNAYHANMLALAEKVSPDYLAYLDSLGAEAAPLIATLANALPEELAAADGMYQQGQEGARSFVDGLESIEYPEVVVPLNPYPTIQAGEGLVTDFAAMGRGLAAWDIFGNPVPATTTAAAAAQTVDLTGKGLSTWNLNANPTPALTTSAATGSLIDLTGAGLSPWGLSANPASALDTTALTASKMSDTTATMKLGADTTQAYSAFNLFKNSVGQTITTQIRGHAVIDFAAMGAASGTSQLPRNARGGRIHGPGTSTSDSILGIDRSTGVPTTWVSDSEFVVNADAYRKHASLVEAINADRLPALAVGGTPGLRLSRGPATSIPPLSGAMIAAVPIAQAAPIINIESPSLKGMELVGTLTVNGMEAQMRATAVQVLADDKRALSGHRGRIS